MKTLFDRTPTGRLKRNRNRLSYSKTDKPFIHKLKRSLTTKKKQFMIIGICATCLIFILLLIYSPTTTQSAPSSSNPSSNYANIPKIDMDELMDNQRDTTPQRQGVEPLTDSLSKLMKRFKDNPVGIDKGHIAQLLTHKDDLEKYLNGIDDLLLTHKDKTSHHNGHALPDMYKNKDIEAKMEQKHKENKHKIKSRLKENIIETKANNNYNAKYTENEVKISKLKELQSKLHKKTQDHKLKSRSEQETESEQQQLNKSPSEIRGEIILEFKYAYDCYKKCAWGFDTVHPISCTGTNDAFDLGLAMIDALDTMIIMHMNENDNELQSNINDIKQWVTNKMHFDKKKEVSLFESTIRVLGGLLSAYNLTTDSIYLDRAKQLGDKLMFAFDTGTGIPFASVDFTNNKGFNPGWSQSATSTSEAASIQLEFNYLSYLTNDNKYANTARKAQLQVIAAQKGANPPLLRKFIGVNSGLFTDGRISFGSRIDSTYEYYLKVPLQLGRHPQSDVIWNMYIDSINTAERELFQYTAANNMLYIAEKNGATLSDQFDHLVCFMGGALALGSCEMDNDFENELKQKHFNFGSELTESCYSIYEKTPTHLAPEIVYFSRTDTKNDFDIHARDKHNLLRPETVESIFYLWRITHKQKYRNYGYKIFLAFREYTKMDQGIGCGYGSINDVTVNSKAHITFKGDKMESFFLAETLKYLYLLFCDDDVIDIKKYVFNTEAHPLPRLTAKQADKLFK